MRRARTALIALLAVIFFANTAGASLLTLAGSDQQPWEKTFSTICAEPQISLVTETSHGSGTKTVAVTLTGDFSQCIGSQALVTVTKSGHSSSYAVAEITDNLTSITLHFAKLNNDGDFRQNFPLIVNGRLVSSGAMTPPETGIVVNDIQVVFAWSWT